MELSSVFIRVFSIFLFLMILLNSSEGREREFPMGINLFPVTFSYPKILKNLMNSGSNYTEDFKQSVDKISFKVTPCLQLGSIILFELRLNNGQHYQQLSSFIGSMMNINRMFTQAFKKKFFPDTYVGNSPKIEPSTIFSSLTKIDDFVTSEYSKTILNLRGLLELIEELYEKHHSKHMKRRKTFKMGCNNLMSTQQRLYEMYNCISLTQFNGYAMLMDSYLSEKDYLSDLYKKLVKSLSWIARESQNVLQFSPQKIWKCDPYYYMNDLNFLQLEGFLYAHIMGKDYLHENRLCGSDTCEEISQAITPVEFDYGLFRCQGKLHDCWSASVETICFPEDSNSRRNYQAFKNSGGDFLGPWDNNCENSSEIYDVKKLTTDKAILFNEWSEFPIFDEECEICTCYCDNENNPKSLRKFSLQEVRSKHEQGVVTGIAFARVHDTIVLKIRVSILVDGLVDSEQQGWDSNFVSTFGRKVRTTDREEHEYESVEFRYNWRYIILDDVKAPPKTFVQGLKFISRSDGLSISVLATEFNKDGKLLPETARWYSNYDDEEVIPRMREKVEIPLHPDVPTKFNSPNRVLSKTNSYIKFQVTDFEADAGQTMIPFFDIQRVITDPPAPIGGVGMYYKSQMKSGGFIGLQLFSFDFSYTLSEKTLKSDLMDWWTSHT